MQRVRCMNLHSNVCCKSRREVYKRLRELDKAYDQMRDASDFRKEGDSCMMRRYGMRSDVI